MQKKISPLPWEQEGLWIKDAGLDCIVRCLNALDGDTAANAAFIVKACNSHDELVSTMKDVLDSLEYVDQVMPTLSGYAVRAARMSTIRTILAKLEAV